MTVRIHFNERELISHDLIRAFPERLRELAGSVILGHRVEVLLECNTLCFLFDVVDLSLAIEIVANLIEQERILGHDLRPLCSIQPADAAALTAPGTC